MTLYTPIPTSAIYNESLNDKQFHTYCLIMEKCWNPETGNFEWSDVYSMSSFARDLGKPRMTINDHIKHLVDINLIQIHRFSDIAFALIPTATDGQPSEVTASRPITIKKNLLSEGILSNDLKKENDGQPSGDGQPSVTVEIVNILKGAGVGDPMRWNIATTAPSIEYVKAWLNWMVAKGHPLNHAIAAMRDGLPAPEHCPVCGGWNGDHKSGTDEDKQLIMCPKEGRPDLTPQDAVAIYGEFNPI